VTDVPIAFPALADAQFMVLTTHRSGGAPVPTTVWFAQAGDRLYVTTMSGAGKARRISQTGRVTVAPSDARGTVLGPEAPGQARLLDAADFALAETALRTKYPEYAAFTGRMDQAQPDSRRIFLEVTPTGA
jgi:PPOX class probable F420-dependent enzyme